MSYRDHLAAAGPEGGLDQALALVLYRGDDTQAHKVIEAVAQAMRLRYLTP